MSTTTGPVNTTFRAVGQVAESKNPILTLLLIPFAVLVALIVIIVIFIGFILFISLLPEGFNSADAIPVICRTPNYDICGPRNCNPQEKIYKSCRPTVCNLLQKRLF